MEEQKFDWALFDGYDSLRVLTLLRSLASLSNLTKGQKGRTADNILWFSRLGVDGLGTSHNPTRDSTCQRFLLLSAQLHELIGA